MRDLQDEESKIKALDELFQEVGVFRKSAEYMALFDFIKRFPKIAPYNAMLIRLQRPGSQYVCSAREWRKFFDRTVKPGANPLVILQQFGPVRFVFELGDTDGRPLPDEIMSPFKAHGTLSKDALSNLMSNLPRDGIAYSEVKQGTGGAGSIQTAQENSRQQLKRHSETLHLAIYYHLVVNRALGDLEKFTTILHELAHLYCGHPGIPPVKKWNFWPSRLGLAQEAREFEAESVAWLVCERMGIQNPSVEYLSNYVCKNDEIPNISIEAVLKATNMVESMLRKCLPLRDEVIVSQT